MIEDYEDLRHRPEFSHLYISWKRFRRKGALAPEWEDFRPFFEWAIAEGWKAGAKIFRIRYKLPASPRNCYLDFVDREPSFLSEGGYENRPCNYCNEPVSGCTCYATCYRYKAWINKSWEDLKKTFGVEG